MLYLASKNIPFGNWYSAPINGAKFKDLGARYIKNFEQYCDTEEGRRLVAAGPQL